MDRLFSKLIFAAALLTSGGQALAQGVSETVRVELMVNVEQSIGLDLGGDAILNSEEDITDERNGLGYTPRGYKVRTGFTTGCLTLTGVPAIMVKVVSANSALDLEEPRLRSDELSGSPRFLSYVPVLAISTFGNAPSGAGHFSGMFQDRFRTVIEGDFTWFYDSFGQDGQQSNGRRIEFRDTTNFFDSLTNCNNGPNIAFGAMVGVDQPVSLYASTSYKSIDEFLQFERSNVSGPGVTFSDVVTVEITPTI